MKKALVLIILVLIFLFFFIYSVNFYFLTRLNQKLEAKSILENVNRVLDITSKTNNHLDSFINSKAKPVYKNRNPKYQVIRGKILKNFAPCDTKTNNLSEIYEVANLWPVDNEIYPQFDSWMCKIIKSLQEAPVLNASNSKKGTQLKLNLQLKGNQLVLFKPAWYKITRIIEGPVYSGKDRYNSEIIAFYLGAVLNFRWTALAVGRKINMKDIYAVADDNLKETMLIKKNDTKMCVYGQCFYCKPSELVCGDKDNLVSGVMLYFISGTITKYRSPWQRTYKENQRATWEENDNYCEYVRGKLSKERILDLVDTSIFDYLIQNGDRHHYEARNSRVILLDNGKGFGNPSIDHLDILAPLYQCCMLRRTTWTRIQIFSGGSLSEILRDLGRNDLLHPLLTDDHYFAIERRLLKVFNVVEYCKDKFGNDIFK